MANPRTIERVEDSGMLDHPLVEDRALVYEAVTRRAAASAPSTPPLRGTMLARDMWQSWRS
jgi:hypothetical protein